MVSTTYSCALLLAFVSIVASLIHNNHIHSHNHNGPLQCLHVTVPVPRHPSPLHVGTATGPGARGTVTSSRYRYRYRYLELVVGGASAHAGVPSLSRRHRRYFHFPFSQVFSSPSADTVIGADGDGDSPPRGGVNDELNGVNSVKFSPLVIDKTVMGPYFQVLLPQLTAFSHPDNQSGGLDPHFLAVQHLQSVLTLIRSGGNAYTSTGGIPIDSDEYQDQSLAGEGVAPSGRSGYAVEKPGKQQSRQSKRVPSDSDWLDDVEIEINGRQSAVKQKQVLKRPLNLSIDQEGIEMPVAYVHVLLFVNELIQTLQDSSSRDAKDMYKLLRAVTKDEGFRSMMRQFFASETALDSNTERYRRTPHLSVRDVVELKRKIERIYSICLTLLITYNICLSRDQSKDFLYFARATVENMPSLGRHFSMLLLCRGFFPSPARYKRKRSRQVNANLDVFGDEIIAEDVFTDLPAAAEEPYPSLLASYQGVMRQLAIPQLSKSSRVLYPYLAILCRFYSAVSDKSSLKDVQNDGAQAKFTSSDLQIGMLFANFADIDRRALEVNGLVGQANEVLVSLCRWLGDAFALHFIRETSEDIMNESELIKKNTVAMELLSTHYCFVEGRKHDTHAFLTTAAQLGKVASMAVVISTTDAVTSNFVYKSNEMASKDEDDLFATKSNPGGLLDFDELDDLPVSMSASELGGVGTLNTDGTSTLTTIKKLMAVASFTKRVSKRNSLAGKINSLLGISMPNRITNDVASVWSKRLTALQRLRNMQASPFRGLKAFGWINGDDSDDDLPWAPPVKSASSRNDPNEVLLPLTVGKARLQKLLNAAALETLAYIMNIPRGGSKQQRTALAEEIEYVFSTWRRPHLLLDYYLMHHSTPPLQTAFSRYLTTLFGVVPMTIDDIRRRDPGNLNHFRFMDPELVEAWFSESLSDSSDGTMHRLPGYTDPQTLFMVGEDVGSCFSIRSKQKASNRGLISYLLNGNCRALGIKDDTGRMTIRAMAKLLVDDETKVPVLYVDNIFGSTTYENVLEIFDQAAELGNLLKVPVVFAMVPNPLDAYWMDARQSTAVFQITEDIQFKLDSYADWMQNNDDSHSASIISAEFEKRFPMKNMSDYSAAAPFIWIDGIKNPLTSTFLQTRILDIIRRKPEVYGNRGIVVAARPAGFIESLAQANVEYRPAVEGNDDVNDEVEVIKMRPFGLAEDIAPSKLKRSQSKSVQARQAERQGQINQVTQQAKDRALQLRGKEKQFTDSSGQEKPPAEIDDDLWA